MTICTYKKACIFGKPEKLSRYGDIAQAGFEKIPIHFGKVEIIKCVVMPNHVHAIIALHAAGTSLTTVVGSYKAYVTREIHKMNPRINVWQTSFHDHVIRDQSGFQKIWLYIEANPLRWKEDCFYIERQCEALPGGGMPPPYEGEL